MNFLLMNETQRNQLISAYSIIETVLKELNYEYDDYSAVETSLYYLKNAIHYKKINS